MSINIFNKSKQKGFTLVEMIVSMAIFIVVALIAVGALLKVLDANRKSLNLKTAINNLNFALESMSREMRVGGDYYLTDSENEISELYDKQSGQTEIATDIKDTNSRSWILKFRSSKEVNNPCSVHIYRLYEGTKLQKAQQSLNTVTSACDPITEDSYYDLISPDMKIIESKVVVDNSNQPYATFWFKGVIGSKEKDTTEFTIQTRVSQRINGSSGY